VAQMMVRISPVRLMPRGGDASTRVGGRRCGGATEPSSPLSRAQVSMTRGLRLTYTACQESGPRGLPPSRLRNGNGTSSTPICGEPSKHSVNVTQPASGLSEAGVYLNNHTED
jgi:hypothetical protein